MALAFYYFSRADLEHALSKNTVHAIYDDDHSGQGDLDSIEGCQAYGTTMCRSYIRANYGDEALPATEGAVSEELRFAALDFGIAYTMRRRPDLVRAMGEESWTSFLKSAKDQMDNYGKTIQRLPRADATPANVGATVGTSSGEIVSSSSSSTTCARPRKFDDLDKIF